MTRRTTAGDVSATLSDSLHARSPQRFLNGEFHDWYRIILGYNDHLVGDLLDRFELRKGQRVLDPFCGTGTTLVECRKRGIDAVGVDANPSSVFAARVKTRWELRSENLLSLLDQVRRQYFRTLARVTGWVDDPTCQYLFDSGMIERGWISRRPLRKSIAIKRAIAKLPTTKPYREALTLALLAEVVHGASNVRFGPELYCGPAKRDADVLGGFEHRVQQMAADLTLACQLDADHSSCLALDGDARELPTILRKHPPAMFSAVICSPPYPTEHDYTRNARLELAFLECVSDLETLRTIKRRMIRSHTKGIYICDSDGRHVLRYGRIEALARKIDAGVRDKSHGFARLYSTVVREYFGGMKRHFLSVRKVLRPGAKAAYVVGEQASYVDVPIPTAEILASVARASGFAVDGIEEWRTRRSSTTNRVIGEHILLLSLPRRRG